MTVANTSDILNCSFKKVHVSVVDTVNINVKHSVFLKNSFIYCGRNLNVVNNTFEEHVFKGIPGFNNVKVINNIIKGNLAYSDDDNSISVKNSQILDNNIGKDMFKLNAIKITLQNNVISNNTCTNILDITFFEKSAIKVTNNIFSGNFNKKGELVQIKAKLFDEEYERGNNYYTVVYTSVNITNNFLGFNLINKFELEAIPQVEHHDNSWINVNLKQVSLNNGTYSYSLSFVNPKGNVVKLPNYAFKIKDKKTGEILVENIVIKSGTSTFTCNKKLNLDDIFILTAAGCVVNRPKPTMTIKRTGTNYDWGTANIILSYQNNPITNQDVYVELYKISRSDLIDDYHFKTNAKGIVDIRAMLDVVGSPYIIKAYSASKDYAYASATIKNVKVVANSVVAKTSKIVTTYKSGKTLKIKVVDSKTKKPVKGCIVDAVIHFGKHSYYCSDDTDSKGWAYVDVSKYKVGTFKVDVNPADGNHKGKTIKTTINIKKAKCSVTVTKNVKKTANIQLTLKNKATKKPNSGIKVTLKVYTGKSYKTYNLKTNSKGIVKISAKKLNIGKHKIVASSNDNRYAFSIKTAVKIQK